MSPSGLHMAEHAGETVIRKIASFVVILWKEPKANIDGDAA